METQPKMCQMCSHPRDAWSPCWSWFGCPVFLCCFSLVVQRFNFCGLNEMYCCKIMPVSSGYTGPFGKWNVGKLCNIMHDKCLFLLVIISRDNEDSCFYSQMVCFVPENLIPERLLLSGRALFFCIVKWIVQLHGC